MNLQQTIRRILREETEGIDSFINKIQSKYELSDELRQFIIDFIKNSDCKKIEFSDFKVNDAMGLALHNGVLINNIALSRDINFLLFLIFHEVAHQYQFKKYGEDVMYNCYLGDISDDEAAKFMKRTEEVADDFASRKIRELQKRDMVDKSFKPPNIYKNTPVGLIKMMVKSIRGEMKKNNVTSPEKISEFFYNMVKKNL